MIIARPEDEVFHSCDRFGLPLDSHHKNVRK